MTKGWWWDESPRIGMLIKCKDEKLHDVYEFETEEELLSAMKYPREYKNKEEFHRNREILRSRPFHDPLSGLLRILGL